MNEVKPSHELTCSQKAAKSANGLVACIRYYDEKRNGELTGAAPRMHGMPLVFGIPELKSTKVENMPANASHVEFSFQEDEFAVANVHLKTGVVVPYYLIASPNGLSLAIAAYQESALPRPAGTENL